MQGKKGYKYKPIRNKAVFEHYCKMCGELYCRRQAPINKGDAKLQKFNNYPCPKCAKKYNLEINPIFIAFNIPIKIREF